ncbi:DEAD/DEAH box helicase [Streptomyces phaeoluteigriseus]|uniref:DEAD/DEAH box helicase n=1 Tax=Streptomyces phaeoluteigriseus TaxID=114686 RepID=A0ABY4Z1K6_9ACTN|nr:DEAD/DEAH box helicase [Streptomyces phaeoluteigriseus]USQ82560.1 DEAD/DEAH box helicase [Streptomyces phaeoluteigriseus]
MSVFARFAPRLQQAIVSRLGWSSLRLVQEEAGEALLAGDNAVILAPTAGGKTEASIFPTLSQMVDNEPEGVGALYIAPIKALLNNQADRLGLYTEMVGLRSFVWHGDTPDHPRRQFLREPAELLMTTPESLEVMLVSPRVDENKLFADLRIVVIDEVHALAGSDRGAHLMSVLERLARISKHDVQRVGLSATVGNPEAILTWVQGTSNRPGRVVNPPKQPERRQLLVAHRQDLAELSRDAARVATGQKSLFFCQSRSMTEAVAEYMRRAGTAVFVHHSAVSREERQLAEERFHHGRDACIVCTSTLELGIDVGDLDRVLQAEAPDTVSSFLQRMGRTGRRTGQAANTTFFCETTEGVLQAIALIELAKADWVEAVEVERRCWPVLIHQLLAMALTNDGIAVDDAWKHLTRVSDFQGIHRAEYDRLLKWMVRDGALRLVGGQLVLGPKTERRFGRKNFMELYAVFSSPQTYTVQTTDGQPLGSLNQAFVDRLVDGVSSFLLGGRAWAVLRVRHDDRRVVVEAAPRGRQPTWGGFLPQFLGFDVCQHILSVLLSDERYPYLDDAAWEVLDERRASMRGSINSQRGGVEFDDGEIRWWTFAGGRINATLRYALEAVAGDWKVIPDNFLIKVRGEDIDGRRFRDALIKLAEPEFWENDRLWAEVAESLPSYRLSKFQPLMPPWVEREVVAGYLLDVAGAWRWLSGDEASRSRLPDGIRTLNRGDAECVAQIEGALEELPPLRRENDRPLIWVRTLPQLKAAVDALMSEPVVGLDVETMLANRTLCLIQVAGREATYLIDALELPDLEPLGQLLLSAETTKLIHYASFEREVLGRHGFAVDAVLDTRDVSRRLRRAARGHSLREVCARELGMELDKREQAGDWTRRPLTENQVTYAALDAEVLLRLHAHFEEAARTSAARHPAAGSGPSQAS